MKHTTAQSSRHSCGKNLYQIADIVIDNCGEVGDCALSIDAWTPNFVQHRVWPILSLHNVLMWHVPNI